MIRYLKRLGSAQVRVVNREVRLAQLAQDVAERRATVDALEGFDQGGDAEAAQQRYQKALRERDSLLKDVYKAKQAEPIGGNLFSVSRE